MGSLTSAWITLAHVVDPGDERIGRRVLGEGPHAVVDAIAQGHPSVPEAVALRFRQLTQSRAEHDWESQAAAVGARVLTREDREWPTQVDDLGARAPFALWVAGSPNVRLSLLRSIAVVGARASTPYGEEVARLWSAELADRGVTVVSGGAFGIDAAAHRGALLGGLTVCVVAAGVDVMYPRAHAALLARIADDGLIISESPPGQQVLRQRFLTRNRLIAALTRATVVVEAAERSGTASTAREAHDLNRPVAAVPGPLTSPASAGCHRLIRDHEAVLVSSVDDVWELLGEPASVAPPGSVAIVADFTDTERRVLAALRTRSASTMDELVRSSGVPCADVSMALGSLEAAGCVLMDSRGWRAAHEPMMDG